MLAGFGDHDVSLFSLVDVADNMQILVELHRLAESTAPARQRARDAGIAQVLEKNDIALLRRLQRFGFGDGILRPIEKYSSDVRVLRRQE